MLNTDKLRGKMVENKVTVKTLSHKLGINPSTFYRKLKNNSFEIGEANKITSLLGLSSSEATAIFFGQ